MLASIDNGNPTTYFPVVIDGSLSYGAVATFSCAPGYELIGESSSVCGEGDGTSAAGAFDRPPPTCQRESHSVTLIV